MYSILKDYSEDESKCLYMFGAGKIANDITKAFSLFGIYIDGYFDNKMKDGGRLNGFNILPIDILRKAEQKNTIVVVASIYEYEITMQLKEYGYSDNIVYRRNISTIKNDEYPTLNFPIVEKPEITVLLTAYNGWDYTYNCLKSLLENSNKCKYEVIVGDNCSTDETKNIEKYVKNVKIIHHKRNLNYLGNVNSIAKLALGNYLLLLSNDTLFRQKGYIDKLLKTIEKNKKIAAVSGKFWVPAVGAYDMPRNYLQGEVGIPIEDKGVLRNVEYLWPVATLYKKNVWEEVEGYDPAFFPCYWEDCDLNLKIVSKGYFLVFDPSVEIIHYGGGTYNNSKLFIESEKNNRKKFLQKWKEYIFNVDEKRQNYLETVYD